ncbi:Transketolase, thiamine diphosphate binding domain-containing protein [Xylariaceae sp. FL1651]|nr:Transketolase, thiamine diphosphate binding domain-containing protein [Xylariaceae sp. FL1651]
MAIKNLAATYNRPDYDVISDHTWCMVGKACWQKGVGLEAISFAGYLRLKNLTVIYNNNQITCNSSVDLTNTEVIGAKIRACSWNVIEIDDGPYNIEEIVQTLGPRTSPRSSTSGQSSAWVAPSRIQSFIVETADLSPFVGMKWLDQVDIQNSRARDARGREWPRGLRLAEHRPYDALLLHVLSVRRAGVCMGALQHHQVIHAATDDSIGKGETSPTQHPVKLAALHRTTPNVLYNTAGPSIILSSRHKIPQPKETRREDVAKSAYVLVKYEQAGVTPIGFGAEFLKPSSSTSRQHNGDQTDDVAPIRVRVVSFPSQRSLEAKPLSYRRGVLKRHLGIPAVAIGPYTPNGWERYADAGICMKSYGHSLPEHAIY